MSSKNHVEVFVRIKPTDKFANDVIHILPDKKTLTIKSKEEEAKKGYINNQILDWSFRYLANLFVIGLYGVTYQQSFSLASFFGGPFYIATQMIIHFFAGS